MQLRRSTLCCPFRSRKRLPAYGAELVRMRNAGIHPTRVWLIIGRDWERRPSGEPSICVPEEGFDGIDFSILSGLPVWIVWRGGDALRLAAEVARFAAPVRLCWCAGPDDWPHAPGEVIAMDVEYLLPWVFAGNAFVKAVYWPQSAAREYVLRKQRYYSTLVECALGESKNE